MKPGWYRAVTSREERGRWHWHTGAAFSCHVHAAPDVETRLDEAPHPPRCCLNCAKQRRNAKAIADWRATHGK